MFRASLLLAGALALATPLQAQDAATSSSPAAKLIEQLTSLHEKPFECDLAMQVLMGEEGSFRAKGHFAMGDRKHFSLDFKGSAEDPTGEAKEMTMRLVADGSFLFMEAEDASSGMGTQAMKVSLDLIDKVMDMAKKAEAKEGGSSAGMGQMIAEMHKALESINLQRESKGDTVRYTATIDSSVVPQMKEESIDAALHLDAKSGFPTLISLKGPDGQRIQLKATALQFPASIADSRFSYTPPEGVFVMDMTGMAEMMLNQAMQGAAAYDEF